LGNYWNFYWRSNSTFKSKIQEIKRFESKQINKRQRLKWIPSVWIIAEKKHASGSYYILYAIDWKRGGRLSWEGWEHIEDLLQFHIPLKRKAGARKSSSQPCAKVAKKKLGFLKCSMLCWSSCFISHFPENVGHL
jgi:hypothetical protein